MTPSDPVEQEVPLDPEPPKRVYGSEPDFNTVLLAAKQDQNLMFTTLGIRGPCSHGLCPICGRKKLYVHKSASHIWYCHCYSGCFPSDDNMGNTIIDVVAILEKKTPSEVCKIIYEKAKTGVVKFQPAKPIQKNGKHPEAYADPLVDIKRAQAFCDAAHEAFLRNDEAQEKYMIKKRGISLEVVKRFKVGFLLNGSAPMPSSRGGEWMAPIQAAWVLPITDAKGDLKAVRLHYEIPIKTKEGDLRKCGWIPFGAPPGKGLYATFWPHPALQRPATPVVTGGPAYWINRLQPGELKDRWEHAFDGEKLQLGLEMSKSPEDFSAPEFEIALNNAFASMRSEIQKSVLSQEREGSIYSPFQEWLYWVPGELKALAAISSGLLATSPTVGETGRMPLSLLHVFKGHRVGIMYDDDEPKIKDDGKFQCTGRAAANNLCKLLSQGICREVRPFPCLRGE